MKLSDKSVAAWPQFVTPTTIREPERTLTPRSPQLCVVPERSMLTPSGRLTGIQKREALNCHKIRHFENKFVVETLICEH